MCNCFNARSCSCSAPEPKPVYEAASHSDNVPDAIFILRACIVVYLLVRTALDE